MRRWAMPSQQARLRDFGVWAVERWRMWLIVLVLAPVLGPGIALFCLVAGVCAVVWWMWAEVAKQDSLGEALDALITTVLPAAVYGCTVWGLHVVVLPSDWVGWYIVWLVAGLVGLVVGFLPAIYVFGYLVGLAHSEPRPPAPGPRRSLGEQMLSPFRERPLSRDERRVSGRSD
jgi:hypothetical protein